MSKKPTVLMILDGYGLNDKVEGNAVAQAKTPVMDKLMAECPFVKGNASGLAVGLPPSWMQAHTASLRWHWLRQAEKWTQHRMLPKHERKIQKKLKKIAKSA